MARPIPLRWRFRFRPSLILLATVVRDLAVAAAINLCCVACLERLAALRTEGLKYFFCLCSMSSLPLCHDLIVAFSQALPITARLRTWLSRFKLLVTDNALFNQIIHPLWEAGRVTAPAR
jgi:Na+/H+ antiporter NhaB